MVSAKHYIIRLLLLHRKLYTRLRHARRLKSEDGGELSTSKDRGTNCGFRWGEACRSEKNGMVAIAIAIASIRVERKRRASCCMLWPESETLVCVWDEMTDLNERLKPRWKHPHNTIPSGAWAWGTVAFLFPWAGMDSARENQSVSHRPPVSTPSVLFQP